MNSIRQSIFSILELAKCMNTLDAGKGYEFYHNTMIVHYPAMKFFAPHVILVLHIQILLVCHTEFQHLAFLQPAEDICFI